MKTTRGEIIQIEGGRSTGRKDRHSKVYTTKGPRDRRVRLAAHTAIQFYDVQDRLGYDRPSKAVDWLINNAKKAIDKLEELPPWNPNDSSITNPNLIALGQQLEPPPSSYMCSVQQSCQNPSSSSSTPFLPQSVNPESIDDTLKLFIPMSSVNFQNYPSIQTEDLCLSLQSIQDHNSSHFSGSAPANFPRMLDWNGESRVGFVSEFSTRQNLQPSFSNLIRAWDDPPSLAAVDHSSVAAEHRSSVSRGQFSAARFSGYQVPARFHGEEETGSGSSNPSSVSREILTIE